MITNFYQNIRVVKVNNEGITSIEDFKNVNLDGIDNFKQLKISPEFQNLDKSKPHNVEPKKLRATKGPHRRPCNGLKKQGHHRGGNRHPEVKEVDNGVVVGPFNSYDEVKAFTDTLVHEDETKQVESSTTSSWGSSSEYLQSTKEWATDLVQDVKDIDFKQSFKNIAEDNDALLAVGAGVLSGLFLYTIIYLVYLRKLAFNSQFEDYESKVAVAPEYIDEKQSLYHEESDSSDNE